LVEKVAMRVYLDECDILLTTDDEFVRRSHRLRPKPKARVLNPMRWVAEFLEK
jgi:hypothetical protein